jgi:hypothetical protein
MEKKEFPTIDMFMGSSATTVIVLKCLHTEVFEHLGISNDITKEHCGTYKTFVWFEMGKLLWHRHRTM